MRYHVWTVMLAVALCAAVAPPAARAQTTERCFAETGFCISGRIREYWEQNGGLPVFGFPIGPEQEETVEGRTLRVQWFERNRLELHPENARPYDVLLGRLGADRLAQQGRDWQTFPRSEPRDGCQYFAETGHNVCAEFLTAMRASGLDLGQPGVSAAESLALFGLPLSDAAEEVSPTDGKTYLTQHFERARFELHPENAPPYNVLLGLLGNEIRANAGGTPSAPPVAPTPAPQPQPRTPTYNNCQADPDPSKAPNSPVKIVGVNKSAEIVTLLNVSDAPVDLAGWRMCSIKGNQLHPIGGVLAPGQRQDFPSGTQIWNNSEQDDGSLYDPAGLLISYWNDR